MMSLLLGWIEIWPETSHPYIDLNLTAFEGILAGVGQSFLPFSSDQCKGRRNKEPS
jgi:hypothetical protein